MTICVEPELEYSEEEAVKILSENYPEIEECMRDNTGKVLVVKQSKDQFELSTGGGKVRSVIDKRTPV